MGEPVKIVDLARDLIRLSGFTEKEIPIQFSGARPGEKLYEELLTKEEGTRSTVHNRIFIARSEYLSEAEVREMIASFRELVDRQGTITSMEVKQLLKQWVPSYVIQETPPPLPTFTMKESLAAEHEFVKMEVATSAK
jgi:FlaA1/EpsC-like NDP-sugar epimerase